MFYVNSDQLLGALWDTLRIALPPSKCCIDSKGESQIVSSGIIITVRIQLFHFCEGTEFRRSLLIHTLFLDNTSVFMACSQNFEGWTAIPLERWKNTSNHDSCWRTDGLRHFFELFMELSSDLDKEIRRYGFEPPVPKNYNQFCTLGCLSGKAWELVTITYKQSKDYKKELVSLQAGI